MGSVYINNNGNNVKVKKTMINVNGKWTQPKNEWINVNGVWKSLKSTIEMTNYEETHVMPRPGDYYCPSRYLIDYVGCIVPASNQLTITGDMACKMISMTSYDNEVKIGTNIGIYEGEVSLKEPKFSDGIYTDLQTSNFAIGPIVGKQQEIIYNIFTYGDQGFDKWVGAVMPRYVRVTKGKMYKIYRICEVGAKSYMDTFSTNVTARYRFLNMKVTS